MYISIHTHICAWHMVCSLIFIHSCVEHIIPHTLSYKYIYTATMKITDSYVHFWVFLGTSRWISPLTHNGTALWAMPRQNSRRRGLGIPAPRCAKRVGIWKNQIDIFVVITLFVQQQPGICSCFPKRTYKIYSKDFSACYVGLTEGNCLEFYLWHGSIYF